MIVRDESRTLAACLASIRPHVDELVIVDTGSTDDTPEIARKEADMFEVWTGCNDAAGRIVDFSAARNHALSLATGDALCWFDGDDLVRGGDVLRELVNGHPEGAWAWLAPYEYERDEQGRVKTLQWRERLVWPRAGWEWRGPVHEGLLGKAGTVPSYGRTDRLVVEHQHNSGKPREGGRNLRILRDWVTLHNDVRSMHYLAAEHMLHGQIGQALHWFEQHVARSDWSDERMLSILHCARIYFAMGHYERAAEWAAKGMTTKSWPEPYWLAGQAYLALGQSGIEPEYNLRRGCSLLEQGFLLDTEQAQSLLMKDPQARFHAAEWLAPAQLQLGNPERAEHTAEIGLGGKPESESLKNLLREVTRRRVFAGMQKLEHLGAVAEHERLIAEAALSGEVKLERRKTESLPILPNGKLRIAFYLGHQLEPWTPETLERDGMGGSETMAWEMSKRLAKRGHRVDVFGHLPPGSKAVFDEVGWWDASEFEHIQTTWDILIVSRQAQAVTLPHSAKARILWVHDVHVGPAFTPQLAVKYDFIWCLSNWHKQFFCSVYPWLNPDKVEVTRNGIDTARFADVSVPRNPHRAIYSSSPDRGLAEAVAAWPKIRESIPDAELHVYYGFENWEASLKFGENGLPQCSRVSLEALKKAVAETPGVIMHGRVNQKELAEAMLSSGVWFYPTWFSETSCITAMEAQAAGLRCVCPRIAALAETVRYPSWSDDPVQEVVHAMGVGQVLAEAWRPAAADFSLDTLTDSWEARLNKLVSEGGIVPKFHEARNELEAAQ